ncbi:MAG: ornithine cyclodeaminase family protein [Oscillospiraceae bacterium]|jgi:ornithine cyclodeaminase/alanine dehydrogenase-like protein (mu-crystallin family)
MNSHEITYLSLSQEDLVEAGAFDLKLAISALKTSLLKFGEGRILFPDKIVQIFDEETQDRINCLPATLLDEQICGVKWVSVFPRNPQKFGTQNLSAIIILSSIKNGYPICVMDGTLCSNMRVAAMGAAAADVLARRDAQSIGFIGAGEQAKMHLLGMKSVRPDLKICRVASKYAAEEEGFIQSLSPLFPDMEFIPCHTVLEAAIRDSDMIVTATSAQAPLLKADWIKKGAFYSHIGGWEDEYKVVQMADKIVCDDWETVKHRTQTVSRCYRDGVIKDEDIYANLVDILNGSKPGRERDDEFIYFNAVGLAYTDVSIAYAMYQKALEGGLGKISFLQESMVFDKPGLADKVVF